MIRQMIPEPVRAHRITLGVGNGGIMLGWRLAVMPCLAALVPENAACQVGRCRSSTGRSGSILSAGGKAKL